jgi:hypothetical protein
VRFSIDTSSLRFVVAAPPEPQAHHRARRPRPSDERGLLWRVPLAAVGDGSGEIIRVNVAGEPRVQPGATVAVENMVALASTHDGGWSLHARSIRADDGPTAAETPRGSLDA